MRFMRFKRGAEQNTIVARPRAKHTKPILCFNLSDVNFGRAFGVPNFVKSWLPHLVRHHRTDFHLRYFVEGELPEDVLEILKINKVLPIREGQKFVQFNFHHFQRRLKNSEIMFTFFHDFHALTIPWKYKQSDQNKLISSLYYSDVVATYFPYNKMIAKEIFDQDIYMLPHFSIMDIDEHSSSLAAREILAKDRAIVFYPSDCQVHKNHFTIVNSIPEITKSVKDIHFVFTGYNEDSDSCKKVLGLIDELQVGDYITWHPRLDNADVVELYRACDIVLQGSLAEGGAVIALEGLSFGKPVCVADIPQARMSISNFSTECTGDSLFWFDPLSESELARAISQAAGHKEGSAINAKELIDNRDKAARILSDLLVDRARK